MNNEQKAALEAERVAFEICGVTVRQNDVGDWEYLSEGYGYDHPDSWQPCSDVLGPFGGSGVDNLLSAYAELQARAQLAATAGVSARTADALNSADWSGVSIGNKALVSKAIELLAAPSSSPAGVPDGWRWVPVEPTEDMLRAGLQYDSEQDPNNPDSRVEELKIDYGLMIAAAPSPAPASDVVQVPRELLRAALEDHDSSVRYKSKRALRALLNGGH